MSVLVYIDHSGGTVKKTSLEAASYGAKIAADLGGKPLVGIALGEITSTALETLGEYGVSRVLHVGGSLFNQFDAGAFSKTISEAAQSVGAEVVVFSHNSSGKALAGRVSARLQAGLVTGTTQIPQINGSNLSVRKSVFSGKAFAEYVVETPVKVLSLNPNAFAVSKISSSKAVVEAFSSNTKASDFRIQVLETKKTSDKVSLPEADIVVSAGRGMKGPENWHLVEALAEALGAATACSRPVADVGWRPHHEHVGQTGLTVRPNLYIAIGISGAIQHLAGVNNSKVIVVINKDESAPFFKAADYGIVGDAFEILPRLTAAIKKLKAE